MLAAGEIHPDPAPFGNGYDSTGKYSRAFRGKVRVAGRIPVQGQHAHRGVVVMHHIALGCLADQLIHRRLDPDRGFLYDLALGRYRQWDAQILLQAFQAIPGEPAAVAQQGYHAGGRLIVLLLADPFRRRGRKHIPAQITPELCTAADAVAAG